MGLIERLYMFNNIYKGKKVLVTGHTGFKGSWLALWLVEMGAEVIGYALEPPTSPNHFDLLKLPIKSVIGDIRDLIKLSETFNRHRPEIVFHMAAQPLVRRSYRNPRETFETNVMGTVNVFEACRTTSSIKAVINITSDKCYENKEWVWGYREIDPLGGYDPYSASKGCSELITNAYSKSFFNPEHYGTKHHVLLASARAGNVIGGGDWGKDRLIPDLMKAVSSGERASVRYPLSTRPWQHVLEPLSGYLQLGQNLLENKKDLTGAWNFGPPDGSSILVKDVIDYLKQFWESISYEIQQDSSVQHEAKLLKLDISKASNQLKWKNVWSIMTTFKRVVSWYKRFYELGFISSKEDLSQYLKDAKRKKVEWIM